MSLPHVLRYGTPQHKTVLDRIISRYRLSYDAMSKRHTAWLDCEEQFIAYMPETDLNITRKQLRKQGKPQFTTIEIPYSYAVAMTMHTYLTTVFLARSPLLQFQGRHGETEDMVRGVEAVHDYQVQVGQMLLPMSLWVYDGIKYGLGVLCTYWDEETAVISKIVEEPRTMFGLPIPGAAPIKKRVVEKKRGYTGNKVFNVKPFDFFPDPRVPIWRLQQGEFCGRKVPVGWNEILRGKESGRYFNVDELKKRLTVGTQQQQEGSPQLIQPETLDPTDSTRVREPGMVDLLEMYVEIVPSEWGLGDTSWPEKWVFVVAGRGKPVDSDIIISARPLGLYHNKFPFFTLEPEMDGYSLTSRSPMEVIRPLNDTMTWLVNTHFFNVRKVLNDQLIVDPSRLEMVDVLDPAAGRLIRLAPEAYGTNPRDAVHQLSVVDVTRTHMQDAQYAADMIHRTLGVNDNIMGMINTGGRKTASEIRASTTFGINRLKNMAELMSYSGFGPLAQVLVQTTQQLLDDEMLVRVAGSTIMEALPFTKVGPESITGFYDFVPIDGTLPVDKFALVNTWRELMVQGTRLPGVAEGFDFIKMFSYVAEIAGARNINRFKINVQPPGALQTQAQAGNVVPLGGQNGAGPSSRNPEARAGAIPPAQPSQVGGMGPIA